LVRQVAASDEDSSETVRDIVDFVPETGHEGFVIVFGFFLHDQVHESHQNCESEESRAHLEQRQVIVDYSWAIAIGDACFAQTRVSLIIVKTRAFQAFFVADCFFVEVHWTKVAELAISALPTRIQIYHRSIKYEFPIFLEHLHCQTLLWRRSHLFEISNQIRNIQVFRNNQTIRVDIPIQAIQDQLASSSSAELKVKIKNTWLSGSPPLTLICANSLSSFLITILLAVSTMEPPAPPAINENPCMLELPPIANKLPSKYNFSSAYKLITPPPYPLLELSSI
jgi:hypothetical protein